MGKAVREGEVSPALQGVSLGGQAGGMRGQSGAGEQADPLLCCYSTFSPSLPSSPLAEVAQDKTKRMKSSSCKTKKAPKPPAPRRAAKDTGRVGPGGAQQGLGAGRLWSRLRRRARGLFLEPGQWVLYWPRLGKAGVKRGAREVLVDGCACFLVTRCDWISCGRLAAISGRKRD